MSRPQKKTDPRGLPSGSARPGNWAYSLSSEHLFILSTATGLRRAAWRTIDGAVRIFQF
jgi:hypothetical protein